MLYFRQLLSGRDFGVDDPVATQMVNFSYLVGDRDTHQAVVVDPAYDVAGLLDTVEHDGMELAGVLVTHHHPDHVGGNMMGAHLQGIAELLARKSVPIHVNRAESEWVHRVSGVAASDLVAHDAGDILTVGSVPLTFLHTPGHTPGSQCFLVEDLLIAGDTLFLEGCGRTDLPGADPEAMYDSLKLLSSLPEETALCPGHRYSAASIGTLRSVKEMNPVLRMDDRRAWLAAFAGR